MLEFVSALSCDKGSVPANPVIKGLFGKSGVLAQQTLRAQPKAKHTNYEVCLSIHLDYECSPARPGTHS